MRQPAMLMTLRLTRSTIESAVLHAFDATHLEVCPHPKPDAKTPMSERVAAGDAVIQRLVKMSLSILRRMGMPVMAGAKIFRLNSQNPWQFVVGLPAISQDNQAPLGAFILVCELMNRLANGVSVPAHAVELEIKKLLRQCMPLAPAGVNTLNFLEAAHELAIPWRHVASNVYQFGWGRRSRWLDSSFTDETSTISAGLARNKVACLKVLRKAGLPVPKHQLVSTAEHAVAVANVYGYPVVVKPANLDGGKGVYAGLRNAAAVEHAFSAALKLSNQILVEQFIEGNDYRLQVYNGEVYWVVHRRPAGVRGNGINTVVELIEIVNAQRTAQSDKYAENPMPERGFFSIESDEESKEWLTNQGLSLETVPAIGQTVRLRGAANVGMGGTLEGVPLSDVHADNLVLVTMAAAALRLDLAGIDFLVPDIKCSWRETGGAICEVNAQPQLAPNLHRQLLPKLVHRNGRIPVIGLWFHSKLWNDQVVVQQTLANDGMNVAWAVTVQTCTQALADPRTDALVWKMTRPPDGFSCMPVDVFDVLAISRSTADGEHIEEVTKHSTPSGNKSMQVWKLADIGNIDTDVTFSNLTERLVDFLRGYLK
jgi:cyanophycin synthetase